MTFQQRLQEVLLEKQVTQAELSRMTGLTTAGVSKYLTGQSKPTLENAQKIAEKLGMSLDELVGWKPKPESPPKQTIEVTADETEMIRKFRALDRRGQLMVSRILNAEYEFVTADSADNGS